MAESLGKAMFIAMVFISGMSATILLEKVGKLPATCQVTPELLTEYGYRK